VGVLAGNTRYYWRVRVQIGSVSNASTSNTFSFTTGQFVPTLLSPSDLATGVLTTPTFTWTAVAGAGLYIVDISLSSDFSSVVYLGQTGLTSLSISAVGVLAGNTRYYWRVRLQNGSVSNTFSFTTGLFVPTLLSPSDLATDVLTTATFTWTAVPGAALYIVDVSLSSDFSSVVYFGQTGLTSLTISSVGVLASNTRYYWRVRLQSGSVSNTFSFTTRTITAVELVNKAVPTNYSLDQNYPNPFNPSTMVPFSLPHRSVVRVSVYSLLGTEVAVLVNGERSAGSYEVRLDAGAFPSGVYLIKMQASPVEGGTDRPFAATRKIVLLK
jgi:hypothetical protein